MQNHSPSFDRVACQTVLIVGRLFFTFCFNVHFAQSFSSACTAIYKFIKFTTYATENFSIDDFPLIEIGEP